MSAFPQPGDKYGKYRIDRLLGRGGMGAVYAATDTLLGRQVALKVVLPSLSDIDDYKARFAREAALLARVRSQHIVQIHEYGEQDEALYLVTELFPDGDLFQWLRTHGPLDTATALAIVARCAEALHDAHSVGVVHRDIKPSNILLWNRDGALIPYLCDFGIAADAEAGATATGFVVGSFAYMAPERHLGENADHRADIYSLGCLLWAMLTGNPPFEGTDFQVMNAHIHSPVPEYPGNDPLTGEVNEVLQRTMAKDPDDRYPSAADLRRFIAAHLDWTSGTRGPQMVTAPPVPPPAGRRIATPPPSPSSAPGTAEPPVDRTVARPAVAPPSAPAPDPAVHQPPPPRETTVISARRARPDDEVSHPAPGLDEMARTLDRSPVTGRTDLPTSPPASSDGEPAEAPAVVDGATAVASHTVRRAPEPEPESAGQADEPAFSDPSPSIGVTEVADPAGAPKAETMLHRPAPPAKPIQPPASDPEPVPPGSPAASDTHSAPSRSRRGLAIAAIALIVVGGGAGLAVALGSGSGGNEGGEADGVPSALAAPSISASVPGYRSVAFRVTRPDRGTVEVSTDRGRSFDLLRGTSVVVPTLYGGATACLIARTTAPGKQPATSAERCAKSKAPSISVNTDARCVRPPSAIKVLPTHACVDVKVKGFPANTPVRITGPGFSDALQGGAGHNSVRTDADGVAVATQALVVARGGTLTITLTGGRARASTTFTAG